MRIASIMWDGYMSALGEAAKQIDGLELRMAGMRDLEEDEFREKFLDYMRHEADVIILFPHGYSMWEKLSETVEEISKVVPTVAFGNDPAVLKCNSAPVAVALAVQRYLTLGRKENAYNALLFILKEILQQDVEAQPPEEIPWQGIYYPGMENLLNSAVEYKASCPHYQAGRPTVGILFYRYIWINNNCETVDCLIRELNSLGYNALPVLGNGKQDLDTGAKDNVFAINQYFMENGKPVIDLLIDLQSSFIIYQGTTDADKKAAGQDLLQALNVPIVKGLMIYGRTEEEWRGHKLGLSGALTVTSVCMPECNGIIEPIVIACQERLAQVSTGGSMQRYQPLENRIKYLCRRVKKWINLKYKPISKRKVAFILHNSPCAGTELSVGGGANLDTLESVARIMARMNTEGYFLENMPASGEELIRTIMDRKAISDFRWTPIEEIVQKGGVLKYLKTEEYRHWFDEFPPDVQAAMTAMWGNPPGEEIDEVPAAMVYEGNILITGVEYGNVVVCVQPKRGCAGSRCDGRVCKILHDPECPPTHQYVATYRYLEDVWGADVLVHVGTHGNLEFLPGKSLGLSESCYPELTIGTLPHLYIYNTDNPPEGTIAKRRSYATLIGHMQTVMAETEAYGAIDDLETMLGEYQQAAAQDPSRAHALEHLITEKITEAKLTEEINLNLDFSTVVEKAHAVVSRMRTSLHQDGMHIFDEIPDGERRVTFIHSILRHDAEEQISFVRQVAELMGLDYDALQDTPHIWHEKYGKTYGDLLQEVHGRAKAFIREFITSADSMTAGR